MDRRNPIWYIVAVILGVSAVFVTIRVMNKTISGSPSAPQQKQEGEKMPRR